MTAKQKCKCNNQILIAVNVLFGALIIFLLFAVNSLQKQIDGAFHSIEIHQDTRLETDLRNRGIITGDILKSDEYKPYSTQQMDEFKDYAEQKQKEN